MVLEVQITSSLRVVCEDGPVPLPSSSRQSRSSRQHNADEFQEPSSDEMSRSSSISLWSSEGDKLRSRDSDTPDTSFFEDITPGQPHEIVVHPKSADQPSRPSRFLLAWPFIVTWTYVLLSPHTKVEETPGLHAVHDILAFGISPKALLQVSKGVPHRSEPDPRHIIVRSHSLSRPSPTLFCALAGIGWLHATISPARNQSGPDHLTFSCPDSQCVVFGVCMLHES